MRPTAWGKILTILPLTFILMSCNSDNSEKPLLNVEDMAPVYDPNVFPDRPSASVNSQKLPTVLATGWGSEETTAPDPTSLNWESFPIISAGSSIILSTPLPPHEILVTPFTVDLATGEVDESNMPTPISCHLVEEPQCAFTQLNDHTIQFDPTEQLFETSGINAFSIYATWITTEGEATVSWAARINRN